MPGVVVQLSSRITKRMVLLGWRSMLRSEPAGGKGEGPAAATEELLLLPRAR
jgi:hypothetical protein